MTKTYEEVKRGSLEDLVAWADGEVRGEITVVVAGRPPPEAPDRIEELVPRVLELVAAGSRLKEAVADVAGHHGVRKRDLYDATTAARQAD